MPTRWYGTLKDAGGSTFRKVHGSEIDLGSIYNETLEGHLAAGLNYPSCCRHLSITTQLIIYIHHMSGTYDHRVWRTGLPVRSAVLKPHAGQLVVWWVTTCESWLLYVFDFCSLPLLIGFWACFRGWEGIGDRMCSSYINWKRSICLPTSM